MKPVLALVFLGLLSTPLPVAATALIPSFQDRSVFAEANAFSAVGTVLDEDEDAAPDFSPWIGEALAAAAIGSVQGRASAGHDSTILPDLIWGAGETEAEGTAGGAGSFGSFASESFFDLIFQVDGAGTWELAGYVEAGVSGAGDAFSVIELSILGGADLVSRSVGPAGAISFHENVALQPGVDYRLRAFALAVALVDDLDTSAGGSARFHLDLMRVPEPSTGLLVTLGIVLLGSRNRRKRTRRGNESA